MSSNMLIPKDAFTREMCWTLILLHMQIPRINASNLVGISCVYVYFNPFWYYLITFPNKNPKVLSHSSTLSSLSMSSWSHNLTIFTCVMVSLLLVMWLLPSLRELKGNLIRLRVIWGDFVTKINGNNDEIFLKHFFWIIFNFF